MIAQSGPKFTYDDDKHEYRFGSEIVPGISEITNRQHKFLPLPKNILQDDESWIGHIAPRLRVLKNKVAWGKTVHVYTEMLDRDRLDIAAIPVAAEGAPNIRAVVENWAEICHLELYFWLAIEKPLYSNKYHYAGTADRITTMEPIEIKTSLPSKQVDRAVEVQLAAQAQLAYENELIEELPEKTISWHVTEQGKWTKKIHDFEAGWNIFMCLLTANNYFNRG